jgi:hypothetical protein
MQRAVMRASSREQLAAGTARSQNLHGAPRHANVAGRTPCHE